MFSEATEFAMNYKVTPSAISSPPSVPLEEGRSYSCQFVRSRSYTEAWPADIAQVGVQALILRDNGYSCDEAVLYYHATKQRVRIPITDELLEEVGKAAEQARGIAATGTIPPPLLDSPKCPGCSLVGICLPDETVFSRQSTQAREPRQLSLFGDETDDYPSIYAAGGEDRVRRLVPARDDLRPLYVTGYGLRVGKSGQVLQVRDKKKLIQETRIGETSQVNLFGSVQMTTQALQTLCQAEKPIAYFSQGGWFYGLTRGLDMKNVFLRREQFRRADNTEFCLRVARAIVASKIRNQRILLQRNHVEPPKLILRRMKGLALETERTESLESLLGVEGIAARLYFEHFDGMLKVDNDGEPRGEKGTINRFEFQHRNRRPPRDPVNALLSFAYAMLTKDLTIVCHAIGFDPYIGFYHQPRFGRPALALDLMEGFRALVADSAVLTVINTRMVEPADFIRVGPAVSMNPKARKQLIRAFEQRMDTLITHPLFGYRVSYRRILEIQARLLARVITGELRTYSGFETR